MVKELKRSELMCVCFLLVLLAPFVFTPFMMITGTMIKLMVQLIGGFFATCWNYVMPYVFKLPTITAQQAFAMLLIVGMLRGIKKEAWEEMKEELKSVGADFKATFKEGSAISKFRPVDLNPLRETVLPTEKTKLKTEKKEQEEEPKGNNFFICEKVTTEPEVKMLKRIPKQVPKMLRK